MKAMIRPGEGFGLDHKGDEYLLFDYTVLELNHKEGGFINLEQAGLLPRKNLTDNIHRLIEIIGSVWVEAVDLLGDTNSISDRAQEHGFSDAFRHMHFSM